MKRWRESDHRGPTPVFVSKIKATDQRGFAKGSYDQQLDADRNLKVVLVGCPWCQAECPDKPGAAAASHQSTPHILSLDLAWFHT